MTHKKFNRGIAIILTAIASAVLFILFLKYIPDLLQSPTNNTNPTNYSKSSTDWINLSKYQSTKNELNNYSFLSASQNQKKASQNPLVVVIQFKTVPTNFDVSKAPLKFNKNFAYSMTLDDGKLDAFTAGFPLLHGGFSEETGQTYPGLFMTDGCGNNVSFRAGIAINSISGTNGQDPHEGTPGSITWGNVEELYNNHWDILNHSYSHSSGPGTDYDAQVKNNIDYVKSKTGITLTEFVIPSGDANYTDHAFAAGMKAVYNQSNFPGGDGLQIDPPISLNQFKFYRQFISDDNYQTYAGKVDMVAQKSSTTSHFWYSEFTHHISQKAQGGSLLFSTFKYHMEYLEKIYGSKGSDAMWMAPLQEVYEYLTVRDYTNITHQQNNKTITLFIDLDNVPNDLSKYALTLNVTSDANIESVKCDSVSDITFNKTGTNKLINLDWNKHSVVINSILDSKSNNKASISVFPNPIEDEINISSLVGEIRNSKITLINERGIEFLIGEDMTVSEKTTIDLRKLNLHKGVYILKIQPGGKRPYQTTIIKE